MLMLLHLPQLAVNSISICSSPSLRANLAQKSSSNADSAPEITMLGRNFAMVKSSSAGTRGRIEAMDTVEATRKGAESEKPICDIGAFPPRIEMELVRPDSHPLLGIALLGFRLPSTGRPCSP